MSVCELDQVYAFSLCLFSVALLILLMMIQFLTCFNNIDILILSPIQMDPQNRMIQSRYSTSVCDRDLDCSIRLKWTN